MECDRQRKTFQLFVSLFLFCATLLSLSETAKSQSRLADMTPIKGLVFKISDEILILGEIDSITAITFKRVLQRYLSARGNQNTVNIALDSPGGDIYAAMEIGKTIRETSNHAVYIRENGVCYSSCVLIFAGGAQRFVYHGSLGIHRPYSLNPSTDRQTSQRWFNNV